MVLALRSPVVWGKVGSFWNPQTGDQSNPIYREFFDMIFIKKKAPAPVGTEASLGKKLIWPPQIFLPSRHKEGSFTFCRLRPAALLSQAGDTTRIFGQSLPKRNYFKLTSPHLFTQLQVKCNTKIARGQIGKRVFLSFRDGPIKP